MGNLRKVDIIDFFAPKMEIAETQIPIMTIPNPVQVSNRSVIKMVVSKMPTLNI